MADKDGGRREFYLAALLTLALDQISKVLVRNAMSFGDSIQVVRGFFNITLSKNTGAAFGTLPAYTSLLIVASLVAIYAIAKLRKERRRSRLLAVSLGLLLGGAAGNLLDRIIFGYVVDFLDFYVLHGGRVMSYPTFNVADIGITAGAALLIWHVFVIEKRHTS